MKPVKRIIAIIVALITCAVITLILFGPISYQPEFPPPIETSIYDLEDDQDKRQMWLEEIHRSAPGDNWRKKDMDFRLLRANSKMLKNANESVLYGKWRELGANNMAGRTLVADYDSINDKIYVASAGGQIWEGSIGLNNWESLTDHIKIPYMHFLKKITTDNINRILVCSGESNIVGFMYSDDEGNTWNQSTGLSNVESWGLTKRAVMKQNPEEGIFLLCQEWDWENWNAISIIYASYDVGESFEPLATFTIGANQMDIWTDPFSVEDLYTLVQDTLFNLNETGELSYLGNFEIEQPQKVILAGTKFNDSLSFYALVKNPGLSEFYASLDGGQSWSYKGFLEGSPFMNTSFSASPVTPGLLYFGCIIAMTSSDHCATWDTVNNWGEYYGSPEDKLHADIPSTNSFIDENGEEFNLINTDGGIYISYDQLENVTNLSMSNLRISQYYSTYTNRIEPKFTHIGSQDQGYQFSDQINNDTILDFQQVISGDYGQIVSGDLGGCLWMVYPGFAVFIPDATTASGWTKWNFQGSNYQWMPRLMADPENPNAVYIGGGRLEEGAHIFHVTYENNQMSYIEESFDFSNGITNSKISAIASSPMDNDYRYVMTTANDFFYTSNGGINWTKTDGFSTPGSNFLYGASIVPANNSLGVVYVGGSGYSTDAVYVSYDNGETFESFSSGLPNTLVFNMVLSTDDSLLFAATEVGPFVCKTWEETWYDLMDSIAPDQAYWDVDYLPLQHKVRFATYGRGIWEFDLDPDVISDFEGDKLLINQGDSVNFIDKSSWEPTSWNWSFEGAIPENSNLQNPINIVFNQPGTFDVTLVVSKMTSIDTLIKENYIEVMPFVSTTNNPKSFVEFLAYPNPFLNSVFIKSANPLLSIEIFSISGNLVYSKSFDENKNTYLVELEHMPSGIYMIKAISSECQEIMRIVKQ